ncbi:MAG: phospholipase D-like domain-containing protein [Collinsella sp.]
MLSELKARGIKGRLLTSTYLNFNSPDVYRKLLTYDNIETRVYQQNLHAKGYMFNRSGLNTVIVGSSNLTDRALTCNQEVECLFLFLWCGWCSRRFEARVRAALELLGRRRRPPKQWIAIIVSTVSTWQ